MSNYSDHLLLVYMKISVLHMENSVRYLVSDLDEQYEYDEDEYIVSYAQSSDDDVDDFEYTVTDVGEIIRRIIV